jgi:hypothetical protein
MCKSAISAILALSILIFSAPSQAKLIFTSGTLRLGRRICGRVGQLHNVFRATDDRMYEFRWN